MTFSMPLHSPTSILSRISRPLALLAFALLAACATQPVPPPASLPALAPETAASPVPATLAQAMAALPAAGAARNAQLLGWADQCLAQARVNDADALLGQLATDTLADNDKLRWVLLSAQVQLARQQPDAALALLDGKVMPLDGLLPQAALALRSRFALLRADALLLQGSLMASLEQRVSVDPLLDDSSRQYNENMIWAVLMQLPDAQMQTARSSAQGDLLGWVELAGIYRDGLSSIDRQTAQIDSWRQSWRRHPAFDHPPAAIVALQNATHSRPAKVAVLLPQSGALAAAANAIRDGLLTAHFQNLAQQQPTPELVFIDSAGADAATLYQQAVAQGAQLVLGPLDKTQVASLATLGRFPVPVLALNQTDSGSALPRNFFEYGLAPEDELRQIAREAWREGKRNASLLYPNNDWGRRLAQGFTDIWQSMGGQVLASRAFDKDGAGAIPGLLLTDASSRRQRNLARLAPLPLQFFEHPRQDLDFLLLVADASQARQIKPLLNFHFASRLPVFALSYVYQGTVNPIKDRDLDGVRFTDIPWILEDSSLHREVATLWPDQHGPYQSLFAMGLDSYRLIDHLPLLAAAPGMHLPGQTGALGLDSNQRIGRELYWAVFNQGKAVTLPVVISQPVVSP